MFHGSLVAIVTPMHEDHSIDYEALEHLVDWHLQAGTDGLVVLGSTGESATIEAEERENIIKQVVAQVNDRIPVIIGTGSNSTQHTISLTQQAMELGADAALIVVPYYNKPTQEGLYQHFKAVALSVPLPQILYNVPSRTVCDLTPETICRLMEFGNIVGVKEATGDLSRLDKLKSSELDLFSGDDSTAFEFMLNGGRGWISVIANIVPKLAHELCEAIFSENIEKARQIEQEIKPLVQAIGVETNPIPIKWALQQMGLIKAGIRLPLTSLSEQYHERIRQVLASANLI